MVKLKKIKNWILKFKTNHPDAYNLITRALWTFLEVFLAVILEALVKLPDSSIELKATFIVAVSAGLSAVKTYIVDSMKKRIGRDDEGDA